MFQRVLKTIAALGVGQIIHILTQLVLPPVFITAYGTDGFALWLLLTAATAHLNTLDFGLQTYLVNELIVLRHRGDTRRFHQLQSVGMRLSLSLVFCGLMLAGVACALPLGKWIGFEDSLGTQWTLFFLAVQVLGGILFGQVNGLYRVIGQAPRGVRWSNLLRFSSLAATALLALIHSPFWLIAAAQAGCLLAVLLVVLFTLRDRAPEIFPRLSYWNATTAGRVLRQSSFFGLFTLNQWLVFQGPVLLLNRVAGPSAVVTFSVARTLFSFVRQIGNLVLAALAPELARLKGLNDRATLSRACRQTESLIHAVALLVGTMVFLATPALLRYWLGQPELYDPVIFLGVMLASLVMLVKEIKLYFQHATNEHVPTAIVTIAAYLLMLIGAIPAMRLWQVSGLLMVWLLAEMVQVLFLQRFNERLLGTEEGVKWKSLRRVGSGLALVALVLSVSPSILRTSGVCGQLIGATVLLPVLAAACVWWFDLSPLLRQGWHRWQQVRFAREHPLPALH